MASHKNTISGFDINRTNICYARGVPDERMITNICVQPLEIGAVDYWKSVSEGFNGFLKLKELKIHGENIVSSMPGEYAIIKKVVIESDETDIAEAVEWELSQQIVGPIDDYVYDYQLIDNALDGDFKNYLVVGYRNSAVSRISKLLRTKKLNPIIIDLDIFALINVFEMNYDDQLALPALIIFAEELKTKLILTTKGNFVDIDIVEHNEEMQTPEGYTGILNSMIRKLFAYHTEFSKPGAVHTYLTGSYFSQPETTESVLGTIKNSEILYPFRKVSCTAGMDDEESREFAPLLSVAVGLALRDID